jgi:hypothetical protein
VAALVQTGVPVILGFARSQPIKRRLAALSAQQHRWLRAGGAIRLGSCPWDDRVRLVARGARTPSDHRGPWVSVTSLRASGPQTLAARSRQRWRVTQVIEELTNGHDLDHLVGTRLHPHQLAIGFRLLARNLAIGHQMRAAGARPAVIRAPRACRIVPVDGRGLFHVERRTIHVQPLTPSPTGRVPVPWSRHVVHCAA